MGANSFQSYLDTLYNEYARMDAGAVASYIPELLKADPAWFGIALVTVDGHVYQAGDSRQAFTIQSISKAITYGIALEDQGTDAVMRKVDVEPSGEAFNSISLEPGTGRPRNPMINAGAIATVALINGERPEDKFERMLACYERYLGRRVELDEDVYRSEKSTLACDDVDHALEWCEDKLLNGEGAFAIGEAPLTDKMFCVGFEVDELAALEALLERRHYQAGAVLCREGEPADSLFFILAGEVSVSVPLAYQRDGRISTIGPGSAVGEMAMLDRGRRSADSVADTAVSCLVLDYHALATAPGAVGERLRLKLVTNIARALTRKLRQATLEIKLLRN